MSTPTKKKIRHTYQADLLIKAVEGDARATNNVLIYLSSVNPSLCQIMQEAIHDLCEPTVWRSLLGCFATHRWNNQLDCEPHRESQSTKMIEQAIIEVFTQDENELEIPIKEGVLHKSLKDPEPKIRHAAGYLAGLRSDQEAIQILGEIIKSGTRDWQLRAVKALAVLGDECCVPPLIDALTVDRDLLHREARRALLNLGQKAEQAWLELLQHPDSHIRWEAARGLGEIGDAKAAPILAEGLLDENYAVRWATADVLAHLGESAILATLTILSRYPLNESSRQAAYHALHGITDHEVQERIKPLLEALRSSAASIGVPIVAQRLLIGWEQT